MAASQQAAGPARHAHEHTDVAPTGLGQELSSAPGRLASGPLQELCSSQPAAKWAPHAVAYSACPANPAAAVDLELVRAAALDQLRHKLASFCAKAGLRNVPLLAFERWRFAAKWAEDEPQLAAAALRTGSSSKPPTAGAAAGDGKKKSSSTISKGSDPVLPFGSFPAAPEPGLVSDLIRAGLDGAAAAGVALQLAEASAEAAGGITRRRHQLASGKPPSCPAVSVAFHKHSLDLTCGGRFVKVSRASYGKLARLYRTHWLAAQAKAGAADAADSTVGLPLEEVAAKLEGLEAAAAAAGGQQIGSSHTAAAAAVQKGGAGGEHEAEEEAEEGGAGSAAGRHVVLCAEARIAEIEQQQASTSSSSSSSARAALHARLFALLLRYKSIQGHGFQAAAGPSVFELLRQKLSVGFECFASPLNAHFSRYGSAFPDVDGPFGSGGSFFRMQLKHGSYEANPPFVPSMLTATAQHVLQLLQAAEAAGDALSFVVLMPGWEEVQGWQMLRSSTFLRKELLVAAADHGYCDGASHQRRDLYRQSPYDSGILFLQTTAAAAKWPVRDILIKELHAAMAGCCPSAAAAERQRKQRGAMDLEWRGVGAPVRKLAGAAEEGGELGAGEQSKQGLKKKKKKEKKKEKKRPKPAAGAEVEGGSAVPAAAGGEHSQQAKKKQKKHRKV